MAFRVKIAERVRPRVAALPEGWANVLAHRLKQLADLAEIHPVSHAFQAPVSLQMVVERLRVHYEVDRDRRLLTVTELAPLPETGSEQDPGASVG